MLKIIFDPAHDVSSFLKLCRLWDYKTYPDNLCDTYNSFDPFDSIILTKNKN
jgi:hypothetical protein